VRLRCVRGEDDCAPRRGSSESARLDQRRTGYHWRSAQGALAGRHAHGTSQAQRPIRREIEGNEGRVMSFAQWKNNRKATDGAPQIAVSRDFLEECPRLPVVYGALAQGLDIARWYGDHEQQVQSDLSAHGAVLFRGFRVLGQGEFERFVQIAIRETAAYIEGATPRTQLKKGIYTSTEFPADQEI